MVELFKILASILGGGFAGAIINEWFRRRREKVQRVQLIERVNRPVGALEGFTLARTSGANQTLTAVKDVREYQLTMRNSTSTHLQDAEVQFEFPATDVQALVSVPAMSRTPLVPKNFAVTPGKKTFRWVIPHFPAGDSVEFTFRAVAAPSDQYDAALYYVGVIFEKVVGEPPPARKAHSISNSFGAFMIFVIFVTLLIFAILKATGQLQLSSGEKLTSVKLAGCELEVVTLFEVYGQSSNSPWHIKHRMFNVGPRDCLVQSRILNAELATIKPGETLDREQVSEHAPKLIDGEISVGAAGVNRESTTIQLYAGR